MVDHARTSRVFVALEKLSYDSESLMAIELKTSSIEEVVILVNARV